MSVPHLDVENRYGERSEKLVMFGFQSFRGRKKSSQRPESSEGAPEISEASEE